MNVKNLLRDDNGRYGDIQKLIIGLERRRERKRLPAFLFMQPSGWLGLFTKIGNSFVFWGWATALYEGQ